MRILIILAALLFAGSASAWELWQVIRETERVTVSSTQGASAKLDAQMRYAKVSCSATCWIGSAATNTATAASNAILLRPDEVQYLAVSPGGYVLTLRDTGNTEAFVTIVSPVR